MSESDQTSKDSSSRVEPTVLQSGIQLNSSHLQPTSDNTFVPICPHKLNGHNYLQWSQSMKMFLSGRSRDDYLTGNIVPPLSTDPLYRSWRAENNQVMSWLINSMNPEISENFLLYTTAKDIWDAVRETFSNTDNTSEIFHVESLIHDIRQGDKSVTIYFTTLQRYWQQVDLYEAHEWKCPEDSLYFKKFFEKKRIFKFLMGLDQSLDEVRGRILSTKPLPSLREVFSEVRREESRKQVMMGKLEPSPHYDNSAFVASDSTALASRSSDFRPRRGRPWCEHCKKPGHYKETCWKLHGKPADRKPSRTDRDSRAHSIISDTTQTQTTHFTKDQMDILQKLFSKANMSSEVVSQPSFSQALHVSHSPTTSWIVDSGASDHMTGDKSLFSTYTSCQVNQTVRIANGSRSHVAGIGTICISEKLTLYSVLYVPDLDCNLISVSKLNRDHHCETKFFAKYCVFQDLASGKMIGSADYCAGLYLLKVHHSIKKSISSFQCQSTQSSESISQSNSDSTIMLWHYRLGHPNFMYLKKLFPSLFINKNARLYQCETCQFAKHTRTTYSPRPYKPTTPFSLIHGDIWGPSRIPNVSGARWFLLLVDDHTRLSWLFLMKDKSETTQIFKNFHSMIQNQFKTSIQVLKTDNARDFFNFILGTYLQSNGIVHQSSCVDTPQQNGVVERKNRHILEVARALLFQTHVPKQFWGEAVLTATFLINRMPSRVLNYHSPVQLLTKLFPNTHLITQIPLKMFGCTAFVHVHSHNRNKLDKRALRCILIGYSTNKKGYKCFSPDTKKTYHTMDVTFFENKPFFSSSTVGGETVVKDSELNWDWDFLIEPHLISNQSNTFPSISSSIPSSTSNLHWPANSNPIIPNIPSQVDNNTSPKPSSPQSIVYPKHLNLPDDEIQVYTRRRPVQQPAQNQQSQDSTPKQVYPEITQGETQTNLELGGGVTTDSVPDINLPIALRKGTRSCTQHPIKNFVSYSKLSQRLRTCVSTLDNVQIPKTVFEAFEIPEWKAAALDEYQALQKNGTWELTTLPPGKRTVGCKWIFSVKQKPDGSIDRYKARLVAKGYSQTYGIDYQETFAPVAKLNTVNALLSVAANLDWPLYQHDVKNAFLNGDLSEEVYMDIPPGFKTNLTEGKVCKLRKTIYGLRQSPRTWFEKFTKVLKRDKYIQSQADDTLFIKHFDHGKVAMLIVYVDDIVLTGNHDEEIKRLKCLLSKEFEIKDLGHLRYFLGMEVARSKQGISVSQRKYALDLLNETGMSGCRPAETPMDPNTKLKLRTEEPAADLGRYQRLVGKLIYLTHTRPDISFAVSIVSQFLSNPSEDHLEAVYRILRYIKRDPGKGLLFTKSLSRDLEVYTDADWAGSPIDRRSMSGYCSYLWGNLVTWRSKKQQVVARSSAEAELRALAQGVCEGIWLRRLMRELRVKYSGSINMMCDSQSAIAIAKNPVHHDRTKHIEIDKHFINEKIEDKTITLSYVPSRFQTADILTKALFRPNFIQLISKLGLKSIYNS